MAVAKAQLGHADPRITLSIYARVIRGAQRQAVEQLVRHFVPKSRLEPQIGSNLSGVNSFRRKQKRHGGRDRDRTDDLYRVKVALVPTELRAQS